MISKTLIACRFVLLWIAILAPAVGHVVLRLVHAATTGWTVSAAKSIEKAQDGHQAFYTLMDAVGILGVGVDVQTLTIALSAIAGAGAFAGFRLHEKGPNQPPQRNAGSRPSSDDSPASETSSSLGPRG